MATKSCIALAFEQSALPSAIEPLAQYLESQELTVISIPQFGKCDTRDLPDGLDILIYYSEESADQMLDRLRRIIKEEYDYAIILVTPERSDVIQAGLTSEYRADYFCLKDLQSPLFRITLARLLQLADTRRALQFRLEFEKLVTLISTSFINLPTQEMDSGINHALELIGQYAEVERSFILVFSDFGKTFTMSHEWHSPDIESARDFYSGRPLKVFGDLVEQAREGEAIFCSALDELPGSDSPLRTMLQSRGVKSFIAVPMGSGKNLKGLVGFASFTKEAPWSKDVVSLLEISGQIFLNALQKRKQKMRYESQRTDFAAWLRTSEKASFFAIVKTSFCMSTPAFSRWEDIHSMKSSASVPTSSFCLQMKDKRFATVQVGACRESSETYKIRLMRKNSDRFWAEIHATPMRNSSGQIIGTLGAVTDISERVYAIEALEASEKKYRELVETSGDLIWSVDPEGQWTFVNRAARRIYGYEPSEMIGRSFAEFQSSAFAERDLSVFQEILSGKQIFQYETEHIRKDGSRVILSFNARVMKDERGNVLGTSGTATDITRRKEAERELHNQKEFLRQVIDTNPNLIFVKDLQGKFVLTNQAVAEFCGTVVDDLAGQNAGEYCADEEEAQLFRDQDREVIRTNSVMMIPEEKITSPVTGEVRWFHTIKKPLAINKQTPDKVLGISIDMTERKHAEEALRAVVEGTVSTTGDDFFRSLVSHLSQALKADYAWIATLENGDQQSFHILAQSLRGETIENHIYPIEGSLSERSFREGYLMISSGLCTEFPNIPFLQRQEFESGIVVPMKTSAGIPFGVLGVMHTEPLKDTPNGRYLLDIFAARAGAEIERIRGEQDRHQLQQQLTQSQKMEAIGQLAAGIAHDLNNALGAVVGHLQLMKLDTDVSSGLKESLDISLSGCERASSLIEHLLGFSRQGKYNLRALPLKQMLTDTLQFLRHIIHKNISIHVEEVPSNLHVNADPNQLQQALTNLIINAQQAMNGRGAMHFEVLQEHVTFPERFNPRARSGNFTVLRVRDTGPGIEPDAIDKIFEPFFTTKEEGKGTGLGLAMVYGIMQNHDGWVAVDSRLEEGARFSLYFPEVPEPISLVQKPRIFDQPSPSGTVMVVDDEAFLVDLAGRFLERSGFEAEGFTCGQDAVIWFKENHKAIDLVVLDMKMPGMDGQACFEEMRQIDPNVQVIILSGYIQDDAAQQILDHGALRFFQKPLKYQELMEWISGFLNREDQSVVANL